MTGCFCTGACRRTGVCPNQLVPQAYRPPTPQHWFEPTKDDTTARIKKLEEQVAALKRLVTPKKARRK